MIINIGRNTKFHKKIMKFLILDSRILLIPLQRFYLIPRAINKIQNCVGPLDIHI